jgi:hypothetical protein
VKYLAGIVMIAEALSLPAVQRYIRHAWRYVVLSAIA